jgi:flagellar assembly protein FliH
MLTKRQDTVVKALTSRRNSNHKYRVHQFPPLRKSWQINPQSDSFSLDPAEYQKQLVDGFQEGLDKGFEQGLSQGKESGYEEGARVGYEEGLRRGLKEGRESGRQLFSNAAKPLSAMTHKIQSYLDQYELRRREELLQLVDKVTRQVIRCELALQPTQLLALVEEALAGLPDAPSKIKVLINPEEFDRINDAEPERVKEWGLTPDADTAPGECHIITDVSEMDVGCQHRLEQCMSVLKDNLLPDAQNG